jgi:putative membrane protein
MRLTAEDHDLVTRAVTAAEEHTDGEIVTVVARQSDAYHDVALHWAVTAMVLVIALLAAFPVTIDHLHGLFDPWGTPASQRDALTIALILGGAAFLIVRLILRPGPLRFALTPGATKQRRVRAKALALFRTAAEQRTVAATGVLLYVSLGEHRAELIADAAIHGRVDEHEWGAAMAALIAEIKQRRPGHGMAEAVRLIGGVLAQHFPRSEGDINELPDRLIEL